MTLGQELNRIAEAAEAHAAEGEVVAAVIPSEPARGTRVFLCAFVAGGARSWLAFDSRAEPVADRRLLRDAVSIAALCELAEESAGGGHLAELRARLAELGHVEAAGLAPEAAAAIAKLERVLEDPPRIASSSYLDAVGAAARELERALGAIAGSPFAEAMKQGWVAVEGLTADVEGGYKHELR